MKRRIAYDDWIKEAQDLFGPDPMEVIYQCPLCGCKIKAREYDEAGAPHGEVARSCIGRWTTCRPGIDPQPSVRQVMNGGPCDYAGYGLIRMNPVTIVFPNGKEVEVFEFWKGE